MYILVFLFFPFFPSLLLSKFVLYILVGALISGVPGAGAAGGNDNKQSQYQAYGGYTGYAPIPVSFVQMDSSFEFIQFKNVKIYFSRKHIIRVSIEHTEQTQVDQPRVSVVSLLTILMVLCTKMLTHID